MPRSAGFHKRIGSVFLPEADTITLQEDDIPSGADEASFGSGMTFDAPARLNPELAQPFRPIDVLPFRLCSTTLKQGCYTIGFAPAGASIFATRFRGTMRVEHAASGVRISGDLYAYRLLDFVAGLPVGLERVAAPHISNIRLDADPAVDTGGVIPIYKRRDYRTYLKGTGAAFRSFVPRGNPCTFSLDFDEFPYNQPATGFSGSFATTPARAIRWVMSRTATPDYHTGTAFQGSVSLGTVAMRWISDSYRRAEVAIHTLSGAVTPPANVSGSTMSSIFADVGWDVTVTDGGSINLPAGLAGININACWSTLNLHTLMSSVPGYNPAALDSAWSVQLVAVPAALGCSRGIMFDSSTGSDPNHVPREGSATFSDDGYPAAEVPDGMGGSHYDAAANGQQKNFPRAYLRSATHEIGHAFNQIHQNFEAGLDNSIMSPTPSVATVLGLAGTFPDGINLAFNETVKKHLRHLPDPAVRPGAMDFFGSAMAAPQPADVAWLDELELTLAPSTNRAALGEPISLSYTLTNQGGTPVLTPTDLTVESLVARVSVTDPTGKITFMRPPEVESCPHISLVPLEPGESVSGSTTLYWGTDGFAFETPGRHLVEVIALWDVLGVPVAVSGESEVFVSFPVSNTDNDVAALLLDRDVGQAVAAGDSAAYERATERVKEAESVDKAHPAIVAMRDMKLTDKPKSRKAKADS